MKKIVIFWILSALCTSLWAQVSHQNYQKLLGKYVKGLGVDYKAWHQNKDDKKTLEVYINELAQAKPAKMKKDESLAYWLNLYNALTLNLILDHYPVESIKDIGWFFSSPWKKDLIQVEGKELTLDQIENEIIRPQYKDPRIHFALNCASIGCPPISDQAFTAKRLQQQLSLVTKETLSQKNWLFVTQDKIYISKILDWYEADFQEGSGSVRKFILKYRPDLKEDIKTKDLKTLDYSWELNQSK